MSLFEKFIYSLQGTMKTPEPYGWFHLLCIAIVIVLILILYSIKKYYNENQLKKCTSNIWYNCISVRIK